MSYTPQPGTVPHRAIAYLEKQPAGTEFSTAALCEELGVDTDGFSTSMGLARKAGLVRARKEGRLLFWSLGEGQPEENDPPPSVDEDAQQFEFCHWRDGVLRPINGGGSMVEYTVTDPRTGRCVTRQPSRFMAVAQAAKVLLERAK